MTAAEIWAVAGFAVCALELVLPGVFLLWIGLAACGAGAATALLELGWNAQVGAFVVLALGLVGFAALRTRGRHKPDLVNAPASGLIGTSCTAITFAGGEGRVHLRDGTWQARLTRPGPEPAPGARLRVVGLDGTVLLVAGPD